MNDRLLIGLIFLLLLSSCDNRPKTVEQIQDKEYEHGRFQSVYDTLETLKIPLTWTESIWDSLHLNHLKRFGKKEKTWEILNNPYAKLIDQPNYKGIIFISSEENAGPGLITLDRNGKSIDALHLLGHYNEDPSIRTKETVTINTDFTMLLIDSTLTFELDSNNVKIENTGKVKVKKALFEILENGKIRELH